MVNFLLGMIFIYFLLPILESIVSAVCVRIEQYKAKCSVKITEYNSKISQIDLGKEQSVTHPIGFQYIPIEEEDDEDNYEN